MSDYNQNTSSVYYSKSSKCHTKKDYIINGLFSYIKTFNIKNNAERKYKCTNIPVDPELGLTHAELNGYVVINMN